MQICCVSIHEKMNNNEEKVFKNPIWNCIKNEKFPRNKLNQAGQGLYSENYNTLIKETEGDTKQERYPMLLDWKN